jgi:hypothetical protein
MGKFQCDKKFVRKMKNLQNPKLGYAHTCAHLNP